MKDLHGRNVDYLRLSITTECNFDCFFCSSNSSSVSTLTLDELRTFSEIFSELGIRNVRLTGGEPLLRADLPQIVEMLSKRFNIFITTNGSRLKDYAKLFKMHGVQSINLSLHSLDEETFYRITKASLSHVLEGLNSALKEKLNVKLNCVVSEHNVDEIPELVRFATKLRLPIRFIELMPIGKDNRAVPLKEIFERLQIFDLRPIDVRLGFGPASYYVTKDGNYVGIIAALSKNFCETCNKIRLSSDGKLYPCLGSSFHIDLRRILMEGSKEKLVEAVKVGIERKPLKHVMNEGMVLNAMRQLGG
ncbi:GTP 3',8-cyclase MoaA [Thermotoga caldifontis]|uniref:GTP 3',8-cyclase MoaA n=1 Tax=Thermotoga caldifontis TaxID=1508419 RepID=UPI00059786C5|nr:GTP 3',8-cyclase MoaA [Thermotoga caldifontis]